MKYIKTFEGISDAYIIKFKQLFDDYMIEWEDLGVRYEFQKLTSEYETEMQLSNRCIIRLRIFLKEYETYGNSKDFEESKLDNQLVNKSLHSIFRRILKDYTIDIKTSRYYNNTLGTTRWKNCNFEDNPNTFIRIVKFEIL